MKLSIILPIIFLSAGCAVHQVPAKTSKAHNALDHNENLQFSIDRSVRNQERDDRLDQLFWLKQ